MIRRRIANPLAAGALLAASLIGVRAVAAPVGIVDEPCPAPFAPSATFNDLVKALIIEPHRIAPEEFERFLKNPELAKINEAQRLAAAQDWAGLCRFRAANKKVVAGATAPRVAGARGTR